MELQNAKKKSKKGFSIIEVMLVLAITGLMLIGMIGATTTSISSQRYNDSLRNFAAYMQSVYSEVISPQSITDDDSDQIGNSTDTAILGKVIVFGAGDGSKVYSATLTGSANLSKKTNQSFIEELADIDTDVSVFCGDSSRPSSVQPYTLLWEAKLAQANDVPVGAHYRDDFKGTMIIARTPTSATVHTIFAKDETYDFTEGNCISEGSRFSQDLRTNSSMYTINEAVGICVVSDNSAVHREVRIAADGRNSSAVWVRPTDDGDSRCR